MSDVQPQQAKINGILIYLFKKKESPHAAVVVWKPKNFHISFVNKNQYQTTFGEHEYLKSTNDGFCANESRNSIVFKAFMLIYYYYYYFEKKSP